MGGFDLLLLSRARRQFGKRRPQPACVERRFHGGEATGLLRVARLGMSRLSGIEDNGSSHGVHRAAQ
jgi:hypothetical protein